MIPIGGYFELELQRGSEYHQNAIRLNTGRNAFEYVLRSRRYKKIYLPYYTCDVMLATIKKLNLEYEFYSINEQLEPLFNFNLIGKDETFLFTNYFGIKGPIVIRLSKICPNLIIDNSQAFFEHPISGIDTFYSPRKFFGVSDGAYLYTDAKLDLEFEKDKSSSRLGHLVGRIENGAEESYPLYVENDISLIGQPIKLMSNLTHVILQGIDYGAIAEKRRVNFNYLHKFLDLQNVLKINNEDGFVPMVYPFFQDKVDLRPILIQNKIFIAQYWPNVLEWCNENSVEKKIALNTLSLPIDQRYSESDMQYILDIVLKYA